MKSWDYWNPGLPSHPPSGHGDHGGKLDKEFVVDIFQTGSGTSTNMNANEVIANRALELLGKSRGGKEIHPNDHVNLGQSSNDVMPTAMHIAALKAIQGKLLPALEGLHAALQRKANEFDRIVRSAGPTWPTLRRSVWGRSLAAMRARLNSASSASGPLPGVWKSLPWAGRL